VLEPLQVKSVDKHIAFNVADTSNHRIVPKSLYRVPFCLIEKLHIIVEMQVELGPSRALVVYFNKLFLQVPCFALGLQRNDVDLNWQETPLRLAYHLDEFFCVIYNARRENIQDVEAVHGVLDGRTLLRFADHALLDAFSELLKELEDRREIGGSGLNQLRQALVVGVVKNLNIVRCKWVAYRASHRKQLACNIKERTCLGTEAENWKVQDITVPARDALKQFSVLIRLIGISEMSLLISICSAEVNGKDWADSQID